MLIILIDHWQVLSNLIRMLLLNKANHAIWQKPWSTSKSAHCFSLAFASECLQRRKKNVSIFVLDSKTKEDDKIVLQGLGFKISRERQLLLLQSRKIAKRWQSSWKTHWNYREIEFHEFLSEQRELFRLQSSQVGEKVYCSRRAAWRKTPGSGLLLICPGKWRTFRKCIEYRLVWLKMKTACRKYLTKDAFSTTD